MLSLPDRVRSACEWVAGRARSVQIETEAIAAYAAALPESTDLPQPDPATELLSAATS
jgi:hypothetical protein